MIVNWLWNITVKWINFLLPNKGIVKIEIVCVCVCLCVFVCLLCVIVSWFKTESDIDGREITGSCGKITLNSNPNPPVRTSSSSSSASASSVWGHVHLHACVLCSITRSWRRQASIQWTLALIRVELVRVLVHWRCAVYTDAIVVGVVIVGTIPPKGNLTVGPCPLLGRSTCMCVCVSLAACVLIIRSIVAHSVFDWWQIVGASAEPRVDECVGAAQHPAQYQRLDELRQSHRHASLRFVVCCVCLCCCQPCCYADVLLIDTIDKDYYLSFYAKSKTVHARYRIDKAGEYCGVPGG